MKPSRHTYRKAGGQQKSIILEIPMARLTGGEPRTQIGAGENAQTHICCADVGHPQHPQPVANEELKRALEFIEECIRDDPKTRSAVGELHLSERIWRAETEYATMSPDTGGFGDCETGNPDAYLRLAEGGWDTQSCPPVAGEAGSPGRLTLACWGADGARATSRKVQSESREIPTLPLRFAQGQDGAPIAGEGARATSLKGGTGTRCTAIRGDGRQCIFPAKAGETQCARHKRWYAAVPPMLGMPYPEDAINLQEVMAQTVAMVLNRELDADKAIAIQKLCTVMERNLEAYKREVAAAEAEMSVLPRIKRIQ
jgi:hypothetical protein